MAGMLTQYHLDNWTDDDFRAHIPAVRSTISSLIAIQKDRDRLGELLRELDKPLLSIGKWSDLRKRIQDALSGIYWQGSWISEMQIRYPLGKEYRIDHDGFVGKVCGYYQRDDGKAGVNLQLNNAKVVHVYGEKWLDATSESGDK